MSERIHLSSPDVGAVEEAAVLRAMRSGWIAPVGPEINAFERELAEASERQFAVALSSGTAALHLGLLGVGVRQGDVVLTATMTFAATANAIVYTGANPVFVDCDGTGNMDVGLVKEALEDQRSRGHRVAAIVPVDLLGKVANYDAIQEAAGRYGIPVISDAAESFGARRDSRPAGSFGVAAAISFNGNKIMTTSGGGVLLTNDVDLATRARYLATQARQPVLHYEHTDIGYNYRLSNLLAALGRAQLSRLPEMVERRCAVRRHYRALFDKVPGVEVFGGQDGADATATPTRDNFWLTSVLVDARASGWSAAELIQYLEATNIEARPLWKPMHAQPVFTRNESYVNGTSDKLFATGLSLPSGSAMTATQLNRVTSSIMTFLGDRRAA